MWRRLRKKFKLISPKTILKNLKAEWELSRNVKQMVGKLNKIRRKRMGFLKAGWDKLAGISIFKLSRKRKNQIKKIRTRFALRMKLHRSVRNLVIFSLIFVSALLVWKISATNSYFSDKAQSKDNTFTAGYWIPEVTGGYSEKSLTVENDWYTAAPCVELSAKIGPSHKGSTIYYEFSDDGDPVKGGKKYDGTCVKIPDGKVDFQAQAVNDDNPDDWRSNIITYQFKVDTTAPSVPGWDNIPNKSFTHQDKDIEIKWKNSTDPASGVAGYIYEVREPGDGTDWREPFKACGLINTNHVPNGDSCFSGADVKLGKGDGKYERRVKAVDEAGNESDWSDIREITLDTKDPTSNITKVDDSDKANGNYKISFTASDDASGVKSVELFWKKDGGPEDSKKYDFKSSPNSIDFKGDIGAEYTFRIIAEDKADDLSSFDMTSGSGDNDKGNIEKK